MWTHGACIHLFTINISTSDTNATVVEITFLLFVSTGVHDLLTHHTAKAFVRMTQSLIQIGPNQSRQGSDR